MFFGELPRIAGIGKKPWAYEDGMDNAHRGFHGWKDVFITNGIIKDLSNSDYRQRIKARIQSRVKMTLEEAQSMIPSSPVSNYLFHSRDAHKYFLILLKTVLVL